MSGTWLLFQQAEQMRHNVAESVNGGERAYRLPMVGSIECTYGVCIC
ncbi:hypothetical protein [Hoylesella oralis]|nr:hypothetical protein [Hoylesella oralis]